MEDHDVVPPFPRTEHVMRFGRGVRFAACVALAIAFCGCGGGDGGAETTTSSNDVGHVRDADGNTAFDVLKGAVTVANGGDFAAAERFVLPNSAMGTNEMGQNVMALKWPPFTRNGNIARIEFVNESYQGLEVYVGYRVHYKDGSILEDRATIKRVDNRYKISYMTHTNMF